MKKKSRNRIEELDIVNLAFLIFFVWAIVGIIMELFF